MGKRTLYIAGVNPSTRARDLAYEFERYAFVEFEDDRDASRAYREMDGRYVDRSRITVEWAKSTRGSGYRDRSRSPRRRSRSRDRRRSERREEKLENDARKNEDNQDRTNDTSLDNEKNKVELESRDESNAEPNNEVESKEESLKNDE
ncbi:hypothetical protein ROZALSC1DRAFT_29298 [Rozella allomycis CSF55]|uniref:RRM domain-containing protein n=1 Tax=Rozella allomycis (strain CSF55) TaxID=988480 RepID=A0A4P9YIB7_ROZAC|nr:hypothetical protein ROZALSC1DRAFT_29298 [Rozella allomycis CSF55]